MGNWNKYSTLLNVTLPNLSQTDSLMLNQVEIQIVRSNSWIFHKVFFVPWTHFDVNSLSMNTTKSASENVASICF